MNKITELNVPDNLDISSNMKIDKLIDKINESENNNIEISVKIKSENESNTSQQNEENNNSLINQIIKNTNNFSED